MKQLSTQRAIVLVVSFGFLFLFVETVMEHSGILTRELLAAIPIVFSFVVWVITLYAYVKWDVESLMIYKAAMAVGIGVGLMGVLLHNLNRLETALFSGNSPMLAPLAFTGLSLLGLLAVIRLPGGYDTKINE